MNTKQTRKDFEEWMGDGGLSPRAIERNSKGDYILMQTANAWEVWRAAAEKYGKEASPTSRSCVTGTPFIQEEDQHLLDRFIETTEDNEGFDIGKDAIKRLANLGVVESFGFGRYGVTMFGYWVHEKYWHQNPSLPLKTNLDRDADARAAIAKATGAASSAAPPVVWPEPVAAQSRFVPALSDGWGFCSVAQARLFARENYEVRVLYTRAQVETMLEAQGVRL